MPLPRRLAFASTLLVMHCGAPDEATLPELAAPMPDRTVADLERPDLVISSFEAVSQVGPLDAIAVDVVVANLGKEAAPPSILRVELSGAALGATRLARDTGVPSLAPHESSRQRLTIGGRSPIDWGTLSAIGEADSERTVEESSELNNLSTAAEVVVHPFVSDPPVLDFGLVPVGCNYIGGLGLQGVSFSAVEVLSATIAAQAAPEYRLSSTLRPMTLERFHTLLLSLQFRPARPGRIRSELVVSYRGSETPFIVPLLGEGADPTEVRREHFVQNQTPKIDVLFVVHRSPSMPAFQAKLAQSFGLFLDAVATAGADWNVGVATTEFTHGDGGRLLGDPLIIDASTPAATDTFRERVVGIGTDGWSNFGLESSYHVVSHGFMREDAGLVLIYVSDSDDAGGRPSALFADDFGVLKSRGTNWHFQANAIVGVGSPCSGTALGGQYSLLAQLWTSGTALDICAEDWSAALQQLGSAELGYRDHFVLSTVARSHSVRVYVDGVPVEAVDGTGRRVWDLSDGQATLSFRAGSVPAPGAEITVEYQPGCEP